MQLPLRARWKLVEKLLASIHQETSRSQTAARQAETAYPRETSPPQQTARPQENRVVEPPASPKKAPQLIRYRVGGSGQAVATVGDSGIRVQTLLLAGTKWSWNVRRISREYGLSEEEVTEALMYYQSHKAEIDTAIASELSFEATHV
ncbi:MAG: hypothetical protein AAF152_13405 [Cyanobacteria bacterium P01_A01_bin.114]